MSGDEGNMVKLLIVVVVGLLVISAQRKALLDARGDGNFSADALDAALTVLDADQISLEPKGAPTNHDQPATRPIIMKYVIVHKS